ncbi:unnamed protein product [Peniophora sp. CBMAI 1063]|nr:unnamed protein product [Peniophora sp. CBMAI 1063]
MSAPITQASSPSDEGPSQNEVEERWTQALENYRKETGRELLKHSFAANILSRSSTDDVMAQFADFKTFRNRGRKFRVVLKPIVAVVLRFIDAGAEAGSSAAPGGKAIFVAIGALLQATKGVSELYDTIESFSQIIKDYADRMHIHLESSVQPAPEVMRILLDTLVQILNFIGIVTKYCNRAIERNSVIKKAKDTFTLRAGDYFRVMVGKVDVKDALMKHEELAKAELRMTTAHTNSIVREMQVTTTCTATIAREFQPRVKFIYDSTVAKELRSWLNAPKNHQPLNYANKREVGSCKWFFDERFEKWKQQQNSIYWVHGNAGAGKSVLSSSIIDTLKADDTLFLVYFYFEFSDVKKQDCRALVSSLVLQLASSSAQSLDYLLKRRSTDFPSYEDLLDMLSQLLRLSGRTFVVIDAFDECPESARDKEMAMFFKTLASPVDSVDLHLLITSRPERDIGRRLSPLAAHSLALHATPSHMQELRHYIKRRLSDRVLYNWPLFTKYLAERVLMEKSQGMFLWIELQLRDLKNCSPHDVKRALSELPSGLDQTYERILRNSSSSPVMIERACRILECVACAKRPLSPKEVVEIFYTDLDPDAKIPFSKDSTAHIDDPERFLREDMKCPSLFSIVDANWWAHGQKRVVQFIHFSVKEYLMAQASASSGYRLTPADAEITLARVCLLHLIHTDLSVSSFYAYADKYWDQHVSPQNEQIYEDLLYRFLHINSAPCKRWMEHNGLLGVQQQWPDSHTNYWSLSHWQTAFGKSISLGLCGNVKKILELPGIEGHDTRMIARFRDDFRATPLHEAARCGRTDIARILLEHGAQVDDVDDSYRTPLHTAVYECNEDKSCLRLLLECGASVHLTADESSDTPLHMAVKRGRVDVACILLEYGALVDSRNEYGETSLHCAANVFYEVEHSRAAIRLLVEHCAEMHGSETTISFIRMGDWVGRTALHCAVCTGSIEICCTLLDYGATLNAADEDGNTPLHLSVFDPYHGKERCHFRSTNLRVVEFLLEHPTNCSLSGGISLTQIRNKKGETALHFAAQLWGGVYDDDKGPVSDLIHVLLQHGALADMENNDGKTPLYIALDEGDPMVAEELLHHITAKGADNRESLNAELKSLLRRRATGQDDDTHQDLKSWRDLQRMYISDYDAWSDSGDDTSSEEGSEASGLVA